MCSEEETAQTCGGKVMQNKMRRFGFDIRTAMSLGLGIWTPVRAFLSPRLLSPPAFADKHAGKCHLASYFKSCNILPLVYKCTAPARYKEEIEDPISEVSKKGSGGSHLHTWRPPVFPYLPQQ